MDIFQKRKKLRALIEKKAKNLSVKTVYSLVAVFFAFIILITVYPVIQYAMMPAKEHVTLGMKAYYEKNYSKAVKHFQSGAIQNNPDALFAMALMSDRGEGLPEDKKKALDWALLASEQGHLEATFSSAVWLERGYSGNPEPFLAISFYEKAANRGHLNAMRSLVSIYKGDAVVPPNLTRSRYWKEKLISQVNDKQLD